MKNKKKFKLRFFTKKPLTINDELKIIDTKTVQLGAFEWFHTASGRLIKKESGNYRSYSEHNVLMESQPTLIEAIECCDSWVALKRKYQDKLN